MTDAIPNTEFKIYSGALKAYESPEGKKRLKTTASSTIRDLSGDRMTDKAIQRMADSAVGMTIFLNHSYNVPEDVFGTVKAVDVVARDEYRDLDFDIELADGSDRAEKTYKYIKNGTKLGTSIGAIIKDGFKEDDGYVFEDVALLEASIVGIPANPRSWVQYALKALHNEAPGAGEEPAMQPGLGAMQTLGTSWTDNGTTTTATVDATKAKVWVDVSADGTVSTAVETDDDKKKKSADKDDRKAIDAGKEPEPDTLQPTEPPAESVDNDTHANVTDDQTLPAQEAQKSVPEAAEPLEPKAPHDGDLGQITGLTKDADLDLSQFASLLNLLKTTTGELVEARKALAEKAAEAIRLDSELKATKGEMKAMTKIVERISNLPIGRRAGFSENVEQFHARFGDLYDPDFLKMLENKND